MVPSSHCSCYHDPHEMTASHKEDISRLDGAGLPPRAVEVQRHIGLLLALVSQLLYATMALFFKLLTTQSSGNLVPPSALQIIFVRMLITWSGCVIFMLVAKTPDPLFGPKEVRILLTFRGLAGFVSLFSLYFSLEKLTLADSTFLTFLTPAATASIAWLFLGEPFTFPEMMAAAVSLAGVVLIARPSFLFDRSLASAAAVSTEGLFWKRQAGESLAIKATDERFIAVLVSLLGVLTAGCSYTLIRKIGHRASATHTVLYFAMTSTLASPMFMLMRGEEWVMPTQPVWIMLLLLVGLFGLGAQMLLASALQREKASLVSSMIYSQVLWTILFQVFVLNEPVVLLSLVGCALITLSAIFISINKSSYASPPRPHTTSASGSDSSSASYQLLPTRA